MRELCHWKTKFQASQIILKQYISCLLKTLFLVQIISTFTYANGISQSSSDQIYLEQNLRFHIIEECPLGHLVGTIDTGNNNYRLSAKPEVAELFSFNASTGQLRTAARVDRENLLLFLVDDQVVLNVLLVSDPSQTNNPTIINILISVEDINDNIPTFPTSIQNISIVESTAIGTRFVLNGAQDLDQQGNGTIVEYTLRNNEKNFGLVQERNGSNTTTLFLEIVELIDREEKELYILELEARDGGNPSKKGYCKMQITILDVNDNLPVFDQPIYNVNVSIGAKEIENKSLLTVKAKDADSSENAIVSYKLDGENASLKTNFRIDKTTGEIVLEKYGNLSDVCSNLTDLRSSSANNFTEKLCILKVEAVDHGFPSLSSKAFINVYLSEEMTESQLMLKFVIYPKGSSFASVDETSLNGTVVAVITLINSFGDNATLEITEGNQGGVFRLESGHNFAILRLNQSSAEIGSQQDSFQLEISAIINHVKRVSKKLEVFIRHFNDSAPILQEDIQTVKVAEDLPLGSLVARIGLQPSSYQHSFELMASPLGYESSVFKMDGNFVKLVQPLQLEQSPYKVMVKVSNSQYSFLYTVAQLNVYVVDVNNHSPQFLTSNLTRTQNISTLNQQSILLYSVNLLESHPVVQQVLKLEALDKDLGDNAIVTYSLVKSMDAEMFRVNAQTGQIFLNHPLDYELDKHYFCFEVAAEDSGIPRKSSISAVEVFLEDVNDNPPIFLDSIYYQNLRLSEQQSTKLVKFQAEDADLVDSHQGALTYQLLDAPTNLFQVDAKTGWLSLHSSLPSNYKAGDVIQVVIGVEDTAQRASPANATVHFKLIEDPTILPTLKTPNKTLKVRKGGTSDKYILTQFSLQQENRSLKQQVHYSLLPTSLPNLQIDSETGILSYHHQNDYPKTQKNFYKILAQSPNFWLTHTGFIELPKEINPPAKLSENKQNFEVDLNQIVIGEPFGRVESTGLHQLTYKCNSDQVVVHPANGLLYLKPMLYKIDQLIANITIEDAYGSKATQVLQINLKEEEKSHLFASKKTVLVTQEKNQRDFLLVDLNPRKNQANRFLFSAKFVDSALDLLPNGQVWLRFRLEQTETMVVRVQDAWRNFFQEFTVNFVVVDNITEKELKCPEQAVFEMQEKVAAGTFVGQLEWKDKRLKIVKFKLLSMAKEFLLDEQLGVLGTRQNFHYESQYPRQSVLNLSFSISNIYQSNSKKNCSCLVHVIPDASDHVPSFSAPFYAIEVNAADLSVNRSLLRVEANDTGRNAQLIYRIRPNIYFKINPDTGEIFPLPNSAAENHPMVHNLTIIAVDKSTPAKKACLKYC